MVVPDAIETLQRSHPELAEVFSREWETPLTDYAKRLYDVSPRKPESALCRAVSTELASMGVATDTTETVIAQLQRLPVLQTSHHITPTHGPTFLALDLICLSGLKPGELYLIAASSGVPFSNSAWSGAFSYGNLPLPVLVQEGTALYQQVLKSQQERSAHGKPERRISLIPARQRDSLVFGTTLEAHQQQLVSQLSRTVQDLLPEMKPDQLFAHWSAATAARIQNQLFDSGRLIIMDINRVIARYLADILERQPDHPCRLILSDSDESAAVRSVFNDPAMFLGTYRGRKSDKIDPLTWTGSGVQGRKTGFERLPSSELAEKLRTGILCPGVFLQFFILRFLNGIRCLGSFKQIGYLEDFRRRWIDAAKGWSLSLEPDVHASLTTGRLLDNGDAVWPLDLVLNRKTLAVSSFADRPMRFFWQPIVDQLTAVKEGR